MPQLGHGSPSLASAISISPVFTSKAGQFRIAQGLERARELAHTTSDHHHRGLPVSSPRPRTLPVGFVQPCLPMTAPSAPSGALWLHEIKHEGFRVIARKDGARVRL